MSSPVHGLTQDRVAAIASKLAPTVDLQ